MTRRPDLPALTGLRFLAAFGVLLTHYAEYWAPPWWLGRIMLNATSGVSLFFILSGFILTYTYADRLEVRAFWRARFARIYPMYLFAFLLATPVTLAQIGRADNALHLPAEWAAPTWLLSVLPVQAFVPSYAALAWNPAAWSVAVEAFFYALFPPLVGRWLGRAGGRRLLVIIGVAYAIEVVAFCALWYGPPALSPSAVAADPSLPFHLAYMWPFPRLPEFVIGCATGLIYLRGARLGGSARAIALPGAALAFAAISLSTESPLKLYPLMTPIYAVAIFALASGGSRLTGWLGSPPLVLLGEASYSLYLLHSIPLVILAQHRADGGTVPGPALIGLAALTLLASLLCFRYVETPARRRLRGSQPARERLDLEILVERPGLVE